MHLHWGCVIWMDGIIFYFRQENEHGNGGVVITRAPIIVGIIDWLELVFLFGGEVCKEKREFVNRRNHWLTTTGWRQKTGNLHSNLSSNLSTVDQSLLYCNHKLNVFFIIYWQVILSLLHIKHWHKYPTIEDLPEQKELVTERVNCSSGHQLPIQSMVLLRDKLAGDGQ